MESPSGRARTSVGGNTTHDRRPKSSPGLPTCVTKKTITATEALSASTRMVSSGAIAESPYAVRIPSTCAESAAPPDGDRSYDTRYS
jgi:hypothetical protein